MEKNNNIYRTKDDKYNAYFTVAAVISALVFAILGLVPALWIGVVRHKQAPADNTRLARMLLVDSASALRGELSAMRLCNEPEIAEDVMKSALVYAVRAETALECDGDDCEACREKEAFLNDVSEVLGTYEPERALELSDLMYKFSTEFYNHVADGADFEYNGEITDKPTTLPAPAPEPTEDDITAAAERVKKVLDVTDVNHIGGWDGKIEFETMRGSVTGYAVANGDRIEEFSFAHSGADGNAEADIDGAIAAALECAEACGYPNMEAYNVDAKGNYALVMLCKNIDGAMCSGECATVAVVDGVPQAFRAGDCDCDHDVPGVKVDEKKARAAAPGAQGEGVLVTYNDGKRDRVCYEYRYELDDGVHYVYVCAENGKQTRIK